MQDGRTIARLFLNYMKKHGDSLDYDNAESALSELNTEEAKSREAAEVPRQETRETDGEKIEGEAEGRGVQLNLVELVEDTKKTANTANVAVADKKK